MTALVKPKGHNMSFHWCIETEIEVRTLRITFRFFSFRLFRLNRYSLLKGAPHYNVSVKRIGLEWACIGILVVVDAVSGKRRGENGFAYMQI